MLICANCSRQMGSWASSGLECQQTFRTARHEQMEVPIFGHCGCGNRLIRLTSTNGIVGARVIREQILSVGLGDVI
jgi:hypothetical protein